MISSIDITYFIYLYWGYSKDVGDRYPNCGRVPIITNKTNKQKETNLFSHLYNTYISHSSNDCISKTK